MTQIQHPTKARMRVLATSDLHMRLKSFDYFADAMTPGVGLECLLDTVEDLRQSGLREPEPRHTLLVDNGDLLQGNALGDHLATCSEQSETHPVADLFNMLGYDAVGLGNHDLDYGIEYLDWFTRDLNAPLISSNFKLTQPRTWPAPYSMLKIAGVSVAVVSVLPERTQLGLHALLGNVAQIEKMVDSARDTTAHARAKGADIVLALAHTGIGGDSSENALDLIARDAGVDALVGGHTHLIFPGQDHADHPDANMKTGLLHGIPTVMPGYGGALVGCIDLDLERRSDDTWKVTQASGSVFPARQKPTRNATALAAISAVHDATCSALDQEMATTDQSLTSYFSLVTPTSEQALLASAKHNAINALRRDTEFADLPLLSAVSAPRVGGRGGPWNYTDIPAGPMKARQVAELHIYSNLIWAVQMTGRDVHEWLERSASVFAQQGGAETVGLANAHVPSFDFDLLFGLNYRIDPSKPARYAPSGELIDPNAGRVADIHHNGQIVQADDVFLVAVNSFRACGGGNFPGLAPDRPVLRPKLTSAEVIRDYLTSTSCRELEPPWSFSDAAKGIRTWIDTGPGALPHLSDISHLSPGTPQLTQTGFLRIPITL